MAVDTANKRRALVNMDMGVYGAFPIPDGDIDNYNDRRHLVGLYPAYLGESVPLTGVEILYSIPIGAKSNRFVFRKDNMVWNAVQKSSALWRHEITTLKFRIRDINMPDFYQFHVTYKGMLVNLSTPGYQPFIRTAEDNQVYILDFRAPVLEMAKHYTMSVTYMNEERTPA